MSGPGRPSARKASLWGRRPVAMAVAAGLALGMLVGVAANGDDDDGYLVRAVFDNGSFVIPGEDVKVAGVVVGAIHDVDLTEDNKAAIVLRIDDPAFQRFRQDAQCQIRLQSLIGEQFIECVPTRPVKEGEQSAPPLERIDDGRGEGQHLLPVQNNVTPVGADLLRNIQRLPQREGMRLIVNELGAGLAGNGPALREAVRRANPALKELDRFVKVLAEQDRLLGRLIDESDTVLAQWVQKRRETARFIDRAGATATAAAERGEDIERNFERFPAFLRELTPTARRLSGLADEMTPALNSLGDNAPAINELIERFGPFSEAANPALSSLGDFADRAREQFPAMRPLIGDLRTLGRPLRPAADDLAKLFASFDDTGGIEELMKLIYFYTGTINGVDAQGHYARTTLLSIGDAAQITPRPSEESTLDLYGDPVRASAALARQSSRGWAALYNGPRAATADGKDPLLEYLFGADAEDDR